MVTRHRLNLSMAPIDYQRLSDLAESEGKTPSGYALDVLKVALSKIKYTPRPFKQASEAFEVDTRTLPLPYVENRSEAPVIASLSRQQRRAIERSEKKGGK